MDTLRYDRSHLQSLFTGLPDGFTGVGYFLITCPVDTGNFVDLSEDGSLIERYSFLNQETSGCRINDVDHLKVYSRYDSLPQVDGVHLQTSWANHRTPWTSWEYLDCAVDCCPNHISLQIYIVNSGEDVVGDFRATARFVDLDGTMLTVDVEYFGLYNIGTPYQYSRGGTVRRVVTLLHEIATHYLLLPSDPLFWKKQFYGYGINTYPSGDVCYAMYQEALESTQLNVNMIENALDFIDLGKSLLKNPLGGLQELLGMLDSAKIGVGSRGKQEVTLYGVRLAWERAKKRNPKLTPRMFFQDVALPGKNAWMSYRYVFNTTRSDIQEMNDFLNRNHITWENWYDISTTYHTVRAGYRDQYSVSHFSMRLDAKNYKSPSYAACVMAQLCNEFTLNLRRYGAAPTAANLWDCVPLSFVIDWFGPVGDYLSSFDAQDCRAYYNMSDCCLSTKSYLDLVVNGIECNTSWYRRHQVAVPNHEWYKSTPSLKTGIFRFIDGCCMFT